jgi:hypothetical protein
MAVGKDIIRRVLVEFDADEQKLTEALENVEAGTKAMTDQFGASAAQAHKAFDTIGLGADVQVGRLSKLHSAFQGFTGSIGSGIGAIDNFAKSLAPWNQALELGGKALKFVGEGMEAYAKTSPEARAEVEKLTKEFGGLKDAAMEAAGEMAVAFLKPIPNMKELEKSMRGLSGVFVDAVKAAKYDRWKGLASESALDAGTFLTQAEKTSAALDKYTEKVKKAHDAQKKAAEEWTAWRKSLADADSARFGNALLSAPGGAASGISGIADALTGGIGKLGAHNAFRNPTDAREMTREQQMNQQGFNLSEQLSKKLPQGQGALDAAANDNRRAGYLETAFGPIEQFDAYQQSFEALGATFDAFGQAVGASYEAIVTGQGSIGAAFKKMAADGMMAAGKASLIDGIRETALGFGSLALGPIGGVSAAAHFKSAALHGGVAIAAGLASRALGAGSSPSAAPASPATGAGSTSGGKGASGGGGGGGTVNQTTYVVIGDSFGQMSARQRALHVEEQMERARRMQDRDE